MGVLKNKGTIMKALKIVIIAGLVLAVISGSFILKTFRDAGEFRKISPHFNGQCRAVPGVMSSEDMTIHPSDGVAFISSADRRRLVRGEK